MTKDCRYLITTSFFRKFLSPEGFGRFVRYANMHYKVPALNWCGIGTCNAVVERVDRLQKSELESRVTVRYDERYQHYAAPALLLLALAAFLSPSSRRSAP